MQASQSSNASDLLTLGLNKDLMPESNLSRISPSPFSTPIRATRRHIERQIEDVLHSAGQKIEAGGRVNFPATGEPAPDANDARFAENDGDSSRERDRRLERSLYEGHSLEAGLDLDEFQGRVVAAHLRAEERASLTESDGTEPLFQYAVPGPSPSPEAVRGAILRLTRQSKLGRAAGSTSRAHASGVEEKSAEPSAIPPLAAPSFGDVARRVWEASTVEAETSTSLTDPQDKPEIFGIAGPALDRAPDGLCVEESREMSPIDGVAAQRPPVLTGGVICGGETVPESQKAPVAAHCDVEGQPALAHDACNLLSALTLYSELLGSPGVIEEPYRHYAEELKLLAVRSRLLIDRLLHNAAVRGGQAPALGGLGAGGEAVHSGTVGRETCVGNPGEEDINQAVPTTLRAINSGTDFAAHVAKPTNSNQALRGDSGPTLNEAQTVSMDYVKSDQEGTGQMERANPVSDIPVADDSSATAVSAALLSASGVEVEATNLADLLMRWGSLLSTLAHGTLEVALGPACATPIPAGAEAVERILVNLVRNARTATLDGGAIRIRVGKEDAESIPELSKDASERAVETMSRSASSMVLTVDDSGCGMTKLQIQRILGDDGFEASEQQASASQVSEVEHQPNRSRIRGLGLQIVRELVAASGGSFSIQSWPGRGTRIEIRWPVREVSAVETATDEMKSQNSAKSDSSGTTLEAVRAIAAIPSVAPSGDLTTETSTLRATGSPPIEITQGKVGPDGFSESELRSMMLRLHRSGPSERSPLSRRVANRSAGPRSLDNTFGAGGSTIHSSQRYSVQENDPAQQDLAAKGAIAC